MSLQQSGCPWPHSKQVLPKMVSTALPCFHFFHSASLQLKLSYLFSSSLSFSSLEFSPSHPYYLKQYWYIVSNQILLNTWILILCNILIGQIGHKPSMKQWRHMSQPVTDTSCDSISKWKFRFRNIKRTVLALCGKDTKEGRTKDSIYYINTCVA